MFRLIIFWSSAILLAVLAACFSISSAARKNNTELALSFWQMDGFAHQQKASAEYREYASGSKPYEEIVDSRLFDTARKAFVLEPTASKALAILTLDPDISEADRLGDYAVELSRRDPLTNGLMIQRSAERNDLEALLGFYDVAMRSSYAAASTLNINMSQALHHQQAINPITRLLRRKPPWSRSFWDVVVKDRDALTNASILRQNLTRDSASTASFNDTELFRYLIGYGKFAEAKSLYNYLQDESDEKRQIVANPSFERVPAYPPLDWQFFSEGDFSADIDPAKEMVSFETFSSGEKIFARQLLALEGRKFRLDIAADSEQPAGQFFVRLKCSRPREATGEPLSFEVSKTRQQFEFAAAEIGCVHVWLELVGRPTSNNSATFADLEHVQIHVSS
ncbi:hypothetical protein SAMN02745824_3411 [Parasphingorhabdus marina DSM 22363]|uniref:Uncharacterized protein n=1 Tax=Parasphingorhabdus marina DSM 22363 TaxID=1123272 RepID=A0A1N6HQJ1_9SPHN|nr:hypothetical protein [Parasphingorhabdus marina]SIO22128.1 hypothetical protein SAMN02745824_3411 [Parasphingorhabdus marina DSM 22363]